MRITMYCNKCLRYEQFTMIDNGTCLVSHSKYTPTVHKEVVVKQKGVTQKKKVKEAKYKQTDLLGFDALKNG